MRVASLPIIVRSAVRILLFLPIAPAVWFERARGWRRGVLLGFYAVVAAGLALVAWRDVSLRKIPDIGEPFDRAAFKVERLPDRENAFVYYIQAVAKYKPPPVPTPNNPPRGKISGRRLRGTVMQSSIADGLENDWPFVLNDDQLAWLAGNAEALELWRQGTERDQAVDSRRIDRLEPEEMFFGADGWRELIFVAAQEAKRLKSLGEMGKSWAWYRSILRFNHHVASNQPLRLSFSDSMFDVFLSRSIEQWAADRNTTTKLIRRALDDVAAIRRMPRSESTTFRSMYERVSQVLDNPSPEMLEAAKQEVVGRHEDGWYGDSSTAKSLVWFARAEPERSHRVARLIFANWLKFVDAPESSRANFIARSESITKASASDSITLTVFEPISSNASPDPPPPPSEVAWLQSAPLLKRVLPQIESYTEAHAQRDANDRALVKLLLTELQRREHPGEPEDVSDDLVDRYLSGKPAPPEVSRTSP